MLLADGSAQYNFLSTLSENQTPSQETSLRVSGDANLSVSNTCPSFKQANLGWEEACSNNQAEVLFLGFANAWEIFLSACEPPGRPMACHRSEPMTSRWRCSPLHRATRTWESSIWTGAIRTDGLIDGCVPLRPSKKPEKVLKARGVLFGCFAEK